MNLQREASEVANAKATATQLAGTLDKQYDYASSTIGFDPAFLYQGGVGTGLGKYTYVTGDVYEGWFKDGQRDGHGVATATSGHVYKGEWKRDTQEGHGRLTFANGDVYDGEWKSGRQDGHGTSRHSLLPEDSTDDSQSKDDIESSQPCEQRLAVCGDMYEGQWKNGVREGHGMYTHASGELDASLFLQGKHAGEGVRWSQDGQKAWRLRDGRQAWFSSISLVEARNIVEKLGLASPALSRAAALRV